MRDYLKFSVLMLILLLMCTYASPSPPLHGLAKKVVIVSLDAVRPDRVINLTSRGLLPALSRILKEGTWAEFMYPGFPACTAPSHSTISTGAPVYITGITGNSMHVPGLPIYGKKSGFDASLLMAEPVWEALDKQGLTCVITAFPHSTPAFWKGKLTHSYLFNPYDASLGVATYSKLYTTNRSIPGYPEVIKLREARGWANLNALGKVLKPLEAKIRLGDSYWWILIYDSDGDGIYDRVAIVPSEVKDASLARAVLSEGEWSKPINATITYKGKRYTVAPLFKALKIHDLRDFRLYRTIMRPLEKPWYTDFKLAKEVWNEVVVKVGMVTDADWWGLEHGWFNEDVFMETAVLTTNFFISFTDYLIKHTNWSLFMTYTPVVTNVETQFLGLVTPSMPYYDPVKAKRYWKYITKAYELADKLLERVLSDVNLSNTAVIVVSDHGNYPVKKWIDINAVLAKAGLIAYDKEGKIIWNETKAYFTGYGQVWINLRGREKGGIVDPKDYSKIVKEIMSALESLKDPETGEPVMALVLTNEEAKYLGMGGPRAGDVIFSPRPGYGWRYAGVIWNKIPLEGGVPKVFFKVKPLREPTAIHGPLNAFKELHAIFGAIGAGIKKGTRIPPVRSIDVAPTVAYLLGVKPPINAAGLPILTAIKGYPEGREVITVSLPG